MAMTEEERFRFDLTGFLVRPAILTPDQVAAIVDQIDRIKHDPGSLPPEHRDIPGGPAGILIDHPRVVDVIREVIGPDIRLESCGCVWRRKGQGARPAARRRPRPGRSHLRLPREERAHPRRHGAGHFRTDRHRRWKTRAPMFLIGSHKSEFPMHEDHLSLEEGKRSPFLTTYACPAGSAVFFTENLCHADRCGAATPRASPSSTPTRTWHPLAPAEDHPGGAARPAAREAGLFPPALDRRLPHRPGDPQPPRSASWKTRKRPSTRTIRPEAVAACARRQAYERGRREPGLRGRIAQMKGFGLKPRFPPQGAGGGHGHQSDSGGPSHVDDAGVPPAPLQPIQRGHDRHGRRQAPGQYADTAA